MPTHESESCQLLPKQDETKIDQKILQCPEEFDVMSSDNFVNNRNEELFGSENLNATLKDCYQKMSLLQLPNEVQLSLTDLGIIGQPNDNQAPTRPTSFTSFLERDAFDPYVYKKHSIGTKYQLNANITVENVVDIISDEDSMLYEKFSACSVPGIGGTEIPIKAPISQIPGLYLVKGPLKDNIGEGEVTTGANAKQPFATRSKGGVDYLQTSLRTALNILDGGNFQDIMNLVGAQPEPEVCRAADENQPTPFQASFPMPKFEQTPTVDARRTLFTPPDFTQSQTSSKPDRCNPKIEGGHISLDGLTLAETNCLLRCLQNRPCAENELSENETDEQPSSDYETASDDDEDEDIGEHYTSAYLACEDIDNPYEEVANICEDNENVIEVAATDICDDIEDVAEVQGANICDEVEENEEVGTADICDDVEDDGVTDNISDGPPVILNFCTKEAGGDYGFRDPATGIPTNTSRPKYIPTGKRTLRSLSPASREKRLGDMIQAFAQQWEAVNRRRALDEPATARPPAVALRRQYNPFDDRDISVQSWRDIHTQKPILDPNLIGGLATARTPDNQWIRNILTYERAFEGQDHLRRDWPDYQKPELLQPTSPATAAAAAEKHRACLLEAQGLLPPDQAELYQRILRQQEAAMTPAQRAKKALDATNALLPPQKSTQRAGGFSLMRRAGPMPSQSVPTVFRRQRLPQPEPDPDELWRRKVEQQVTQMRESCECEFPDPNLPLHSSVQVARAHTPQNPQAQLIREAARIGAQAATRYLATHSQPPSRSSSPVQTPYGTRSEVYIPMQADDYSPPEVQPTRSKTRGVRSRSTSRSPSIQRRPLTYNELSTGKRTNRPGFSGRTYDSMRKLGISMQQGYRPRGMPLSRTRLSPIQSSPLIPSRPRQCGLLSERSGATRSEQLRGMLAQRPVGLTREEERIRAARAGRVLISEEEEECMMQSGLAAEKRLAQLFKLQVEDQRREEAFCQNRGGAQSQINVSKMQQSRVNVPARYVRSQGALPRQQDRKVPIPRIVITQPSFRAHSGVVNPKMKLWRDKESINSIQKVRTQQYPYLQDATMPDIPTIDFNYLNKTMTLPIANNSTCISRSQGF